MAMQKIGKMKKHEMGESKSFERSEERMDKKHFAHEGMENMSEHRQKYYTKGHAINSRETSGM